MFEYQKTYNYNKNYYYLHRNHIFYQQRDDIITVPESAKTKKVIPIGEEFFIPEFKISNCNQSAMNESIQYMRKFNISMKKVNNVIREAGDAIKDEANRFYERINELINNNKEEIDRLEKELAEKERYLYGFLDCPKDSLETSTLCLTSEAQRTIREIRELERKLNLLKLKSKSSIWGSVNTSLKQFQDNLAVSAHSESLSNITWPKSWPKIEEIQSIPVIIEDAIDIPQTINDMEIDPSVILNIPLPQSIENMINIPLPDIDLDLDALKGQIQYDDLGFSVQEVLTDLTNKAIAELQKYNMCLFIKNSPYLLQITIEYISDFREFVESYVYGCFKKAKDAAVLAFAKHIPTIISSYGTAIPVAVSDAFLMYWATLKQCFINVYYTFKKEIEKILNVESFDGFLKAIEKYVSIDITLDKRDVPWENKGSLVDLATGNV